MTMLLWILFVNVLIFLSPVFAESDSDFILPIEQSDAVSEHVGLWPFGVQGGEHPQGHPGFDFEAHVGTPIRAVADGSVGFVGPSGHHEGMTISIGHMTSRGWVDTYYTGSITDIHVKKGDHVKQGEVIASYAASEHLGMPRGLSTFHFGVDQLIIADRRESVCPADYFTQEAQRAVEELHRQSKYRERATFPLLCNSCPTGGCR